MILPKPLLQAMKGTTLGTLLIRGHQRSVMVIHPSLPLVSILHPRIRQAMQVTTLGTPLSLIKFFHSSLISRQLITKPSKDADLPVDVLLLTVTNCEFLACYSELKNPYRCWFDGLGYVYFSDVGESQEELKVALLRCYRNGIGPGGALISVKNAASVLRPKAVISVGTCSGLNPAKSKLGDVVVSAKLATYASKVVTGNQEQSTGMRSYVSKRFLDVIKNCADGWQAPLKNPEAQQVQVYTDAEFLSGPEQVRAEWRRDQLAETNPQAMAIESDGEGELTVFKLPVYIST